MALIGEQSSSKGYGTSSMAPGWASYFSSATSPKNNTNSSASVSSASFFDYLKEHTTFESDESDEDAVFTSAPRVKNASARAPPGASPSNKSKKSYTPPSSSDGEYTVDDDVSSAANMKHSTYPMPDIELIGELLGHIERSPPALGARELLMQQYTTYGWFEAAGDLAQEVLELDPMNGAAKTCLDHLLGTAAGKGKGKGKEGENTKKERQTKANGKGKRKERKNTKKERQMKANGKGKSKTEKGGRRRTQAGGAAAWQPTLTPIASPKSALRKLEEGYKAMLENAKLLHSEAKLLHDLKGMRALDREGHILDLAALAQGKVTSVIRPKQLESVKTIAKAMMTENTGGSEARIDIAFKDLEEMMRWLRRSDEGKAARSDDRDALRDALVKRVRALKGLLPSDLQVLADKALMHAEHELLQRTYVNTETMYGDEVSDIPRENFFVSEDGYAWDMEELAQAITSGGGVMRNPLSKLMFTPADVGHIVQHPQGKGLAALQVAQSKLKKGVRPKTIDELDRLAKVLLTDQTEDQAPSRHAVDEFAAYLATLPRAEQKAIDGLRVPAKDSHTGMEFDTTIGEAVKDAQGNRVCSHKIGDFLSQAAKHLRK